MSATLRHQLLGSSPAATAAFSTCSYCSFVRRNVMFLDLVCLLSSISKPPCLALHTRPVPVYKFAYNSYTNALSLLFSASRNCRHEHLQRRCVSPEFQGVTCQIHLRCVAPTVAVDSWIRNETVSSRPAWSKCR